MEKRQVDFPFGPIPHWVKVSDKPPEIGIHVWVYAFFEYGWQYEAFWDGQNWETDDERPLFNVTHWMPLMPAPKEDLNA